MVRHARALLVLMTGLFILWCGTPGLDYMKAKHYDEPKEQQQLREAVGEPWASIVIGIYAFNREIRLPSYRKIAPIQRIFRIRQSWHLYRDGPSRVRRLEIWVDDTLVHRTADPAYDWHAEVLRNRRLRPMVETTTRKPHATNWQGLTRWIVGQAREDFPDAKRVELRAMWTPYPGKRPSQMHHGFYAQAPKWTVRKTKMSKRDDDPKRKRTDKVQDAGAADAADAADAPSDATERFKARDGGVPTAEGGPP